MWLDGPGPRASGLLSGSSRDLPQRRRRERWTHISDSRRCLVIGNHEPGAGRHGAELDGIGTRWPPAAPGHRCQTWGLSLVFWPVAADAALELTRRVKSGLEQQRCTGQYSAWSRAVAAGGDANDAEVPVGPRPRQRIQAFVDQHDDIALRPQEASCCNGQQPTDPTGPGTVDILLAAASVVLLTIGLATFGWWVTDQPVPSTPPGSRRVRPSQPVGAAIVAGFYAARAFGLEFARERRWEESQRSAERVLTPPGPLSSSPIVQTCTGGHRGRLRGLHRQWRIGYRNSSDLPVSDVRNCLATAEILIHRCAGRGDLAGGNSLLGAGQKGRRHGPRAELDSLQSLRGKGHGHRRVQHVRHHAISR